MKIVAVCGSGLGSSLILEMNAKQIMRDLGIEAEVSRCDVKSAKEAQADVYITSEYLSHALQGTKGRVVTVVNLLDQENLREKLLTVLEASPR